MFFKLSAIFFWVVTIFNVVLAQDVFISLPTANTSVTAGSDIVVRLDKPDALTGSEDITVVIGAFECASPTTCPDVAEVLGDILYSGPYSPKFRDNNDYNPYQNFTVTVPSWYSGTVQLGVAHLFLLGAGFSAVLQFTNTTLNVLKP